MPTPAEHKTAAEAFLTRVGAPGHTEPLEIDRRVAEVHAILATRTGTGEHYTTADTTLATAKNYLSVDTAKVHALLAEPAT